MKLKKKLWISPLSKVCSLPSVCFHVFSTRSPYHCSPLPLFHWRVPSWNDSFEKLAKVLFCDSQTFTISIKYFPQDTMFFHCFLPFWASFTSSHALTTALIETSSTCNPWASKSHNNCTATCHSPLLLQASKTLFKVIRSLQWNLFWKLFWRDGIW